MLEDIADVLSFKRICSHVELGSLETQLTAIMNSMSIIEHCYSQMKHNSYQARPRRRAPSCTVRPHHDK